MNSGSRPSSTSAQGGTVLQTYLLGAVEFDAALALQRRLAYQVGGDRDTGCLLCCEHPPIITVGRRGSWTHIRCEPDELRARQWTVRWVNRGGGTMLHLPGQLAIYPIVPLDRLQLGVQDYLEKLQQVVIASLDDFGVIGTRREGTSGIWVRDKSIAEVGIAVRDWVSYYGLTLNVDPPLDAFRRVRCGEPAHDRMTSLTIERRGPLRPSMVRERILEHFLAEFPYARTSLFTDHPSLKKEVRADAVASRR